MNCKEGDLCVVVVPGRPADGMIVRCVKYLGFGFIGTSVGVKSKHVWELDRAVPAFDGKPTKVSQDDVLRPIRDPGDDAVDQTLEWLDVPTKQGEPA